MFKSNQAEERRTWTGASIWCSNSVFAHNKRSKTQPNTSNLDVNSFAMRKKSINGIQIQMSLP